MNNDDQQEAVSTEPTQLSARWRIALGVAALCLAIPLGVAFWLSPDNHGYGTHQQLGLPPCTMKLLLGVRCPSCGMTTSWSCAAHGNLLGALRANATGTMLFLGAVIALIETACSAVLGRYAPFRVTENMVLAFMIFIAFSAIVEWGIRVAYFE